MVSAVAFPFTRLARVPRGSLGVSNAAARWIAATRTQGARVAALVGDPVQLAWSRGALGDPDAASCVVRIGGQELEVRGASAFVRTFAQRVLGGEAELAAPRRLTEVEEAMWTLLVAAAVEDLGIRGEVWPNEREGGDAGGGERVRIALELAVGGDREGRGVAQFATFATIELAFDPAVALAAPPARIPAWADGVVLACPLVVGRCALVREDLRRLGPRSVITLDRPLGQAELVVLGGALGLAAGEGAAVTDPLVARVATEYVPRPMALPDDARVELTVGLGTAQLSLRQVMGLAIGEVVPLGRPLAGPFEVRAEGKLIGQGELVDVDGELGVRIVSIAQE